MNVISSTDLVGKRITSWIFNNHPQEDDYIIVTLDNKDIYKFIGEISCCDESWFEFPNGYPPNKTVKSFESDKFIDLPESGRQECDSNHVLKFIFEDDSIFIWYLRDSSNGYYDCYLNIRQLSEDEAVKYTHTQI